MSDQGFKSGVAQGVASNLVGAALTTPQCQAAVAGTMAVAIAAAPAIALFAVGGAIGGGIAYGLVKLIDLIDS